MFGTQSLFDSSKHSLNVEIIICIWTDGGMEAKVTQVLSDQIMIQILI
jgi:hypothetical protein